MSKEMKDKLINTGVTDESVLEGGTQKVQIVLDKDGNGPINKKYQVVFVDEYNNWYNIGFFDNLRDAEPDLNGYLDSYEFEEGEENEFKTLKFGDGKDCTLGHLEEYAGTFNSVFDRNFCTTCGYVSVRGFVFN